MSKPKLIYPDCGAEMNHHAMKIDYGVDDPAVVDPVFGGAVKGAHLSRVRAGEITSGLTKTHDERPRQKIEAHGQRAVAGIALRPEAEPALFLPLFKRFSGHISALRDTERHKKSASLLSVCDFVRNVETV